jgi:hypothetical protein
MKGLSRNEKQAAHYPHSDAGKQSRADGRGGRTDNGSPRSFEKPPEGAEKENDENPVCG